MLFILSVVDIYIHIKDEKQWPGKSEQMTLMSHELQIQKLDESKQLLSSKILPKDIPWDTSWDKYGVLFVLSPISD